MKKILACIFAVSVITTAAFSKNFFSQRFFEIKVGTDVDFSNNLFAMNDFMKKDLVIDLRKIADECPEKGFNIRADLAPIYEMNLNIKDFHLGLSSGIEMYESLSVGKDLFDFLGYGNSIGETLNFSLNNDTDVLKRFSKEQLEDIADGVIPEGFVWHHNEEEGLMQLVDAVIHDKTGHTGGMHLWGRGYD